MLRCQRFLLRVFLVICSTLEPSLSCFIPFDLIYQLIEMEIADLCHEFGTSIRRFLNDVSGLVNRARQSIQDLVWNLKLLEEYLLLSSDDECKMLRVFGDTMVHYADVFDTVDVVAKSAPKQLSYGFGVFLLYTSTDHCNDMGLILIEVKDCLDSDDFDALSVFCAICSTLNLVVCLQQVSIDAMATIAPSMKAPRVPSLVVFR